MSYSGRSYVGEVYHGAGGASAGIDPSVLWSVPGAVTATSSLVVARVDRAGAVILEVDTDSGFSSPTAFGPESAGLGGGAVRLEATGLSADTAYHYRLTTEDGTALGDAGEFRTAPVAGTAKTFTFAVGNCSETGSTHAVFAAIHAHDPVLMIHLGDLHYEDIGAEDETAYRAGYDDSVGVTEQNALYRKRGWVYTWGDHDFGANDAHAGTTGKATAQQVYRERVPHHELELEGPEDAIYHAFTWGRVRFLVTDARSYRDPRTDAEGASKTLLGSAQKAWFLDEIQSARDAGLLVCWAQENAWVSETAGDDQWADYTTEREEIADQIQALGMNRRIFILSGDHHFLAYDDGTNSNYAGTPVGKGPPNTIGAPLDRTNVVDRTSEFSGGGQLVSGGRGQYQLITITDTGGPTIDVTYEGRYTETDGEDNLWATATFTLSAPVELTPAAAELTITGFAPTLTVTDSHEPDSTIDAGTWRSSIDNSTDLHVPLADDTDDNWARSGSDPESEASIAGWAEISDPGVDTGHTFRYRYSKDAAGGRQISLTTRVLAVETEIAERVHSDIPAAVTEGEINLTESEVQAFRAAGGYDDLRVELVASRVGGGASRRARVYFMEFELPTPVSVALAPGVAELTLTGFAPTVSIGGNVVLEPDTAELTLAGFAPTVEVAEDVDPAEVGWTTYGTARISGVDELDGPKKFRIQMADESWVARRSRLFETGGTTSMWPMGIRGVWRGISSFGDPTAIRADGQLQETDGTLFRVLLETGGQLGTPLTHDRGRWITEMLTRWADADRLPEEDWDFSPSGSGGNFRYLRLYYAEAAGAGAGTDQSVEMSESAEADIAYEADFAGEPSWNDQYRFEWIALQAVPQTWNARWDFWHYDASADEWSVVDSMIFVADTTLAHLTWWVEIEGVAAGDKFGMSLHEFSNDPGDWGGEAVSWQAEGAPDEDAHTYEIVAFGLPVSEDTMLAGLEEAANAVQNPGSGSSERWALDVWARLPDGADPPPSTGKGFLYAPDAPPDEVVPVHIGTSDHPVQGYRDPDWGVPPEQNGFIHAADLTRRYFESMGQRYDDEALAEIEADPTFPALAPRLTETPNDPEKWMQENVWGPLMLLALKDGEGKRKLKDIRPPSREASITGLEEMDETNARGHRWRLVGREQMNYLLWRYLGIRPARTLGGDSASGTPSSTDADALDALVIDERTLPPEEAQNLGDVGQREREFNIHAALADPRAPEEWITACEESEVGAPFVAETVSQHSAFLLTTYAHGPHHGTGEIGRAVAENLEEGDYAIVDAESLQLVNPYTTSRTGHVLVLVLSLTRYPERADIEYLLVRPVDLAEPEPTEPGDWVFVNMALKAQGVSGSDDFGSVTGDGDGFFDGTDGDFGTFTGYPGDGTFMGAVYDEEAEVFLVFRGTDGDQETPAVSPTVQRSEDGGQTWLTPVDPTDAWGEYQVFSGERYTYLWLQAAGNGCVVVLGQFGGWSKSTDGGLTWSDWHEPEGSGEDGGWFPDPHGVAHGTGGQFCWTSGDPAVVRSIGSPTPTDWEVSLSVDDRAIDFPLVGAYGNEIWVFTARNKLHSPGESDGGGSVQRNLSSDLDPAQWEATARRTVSLAFETDVYEGEGADSEVVAYFPRRILYFEDASGGGRWWAFRSDQSLVFSDDDGVTWSKDLCDHAAADDSGMFPFFDHRGAITLGESVRPRVTDMAQDPENPDHLLAIGRTYTGQSGITNRRAVYCESTDGGDTWGTVRQLPISDALDIPGAGYLFSIAKDES